MKNYLNIEKISILENLIKSEWNNSDKNSFNYWRESTNKLVNDICSGKIDYTKGLVDLSKKLNTIPKILEDKTTNKVLVVTIFDHSLSDKERSINRLNIFRKIYKVKDLNCHCDAIELPITLDEISAKCLRGGYDSIYFDKYVIAALGGIKEIITKVPSGVDIFYDDKNNGLISLRTRRYLYDC